MSRRITFRGTLTYQPYSLWGILCGWAIVMALVFASALPANAIVGGTDVASPAKWPTLALLAGPDPTPGQSKYCTGTVVRPQWVLSAAHCFVAHADQAGDVSLRSWLVRVGWTSNDSPNRGLVFQSDALFVHPKYTGGSSYDLALLHLSTAVTVVPPSVTVAPQVLATADQTNAAISGEHWAVGYGSPYDVNGFPVLREIVLKGKLEIAGPILRINNVDTKHNIQPGDSGGPLFVPTDRRRSSWLEIGSLEGMHKDCRICKPYDIYTNLSYAPISQWIDSVIRVPSAPQNVSAIAITNGLRVSWAAPADNGGSAVTSYIVHWDDGVSDQVRTLPPNQLSYDIGGLTAGRSYKVDVSASNAYGAGVSTSLSATAGGNYLLVSPSLNQGVTTLGEVFFDKVYTVNSPERSVALAGSSDGQSGFYVDDQITIQVTHSDGTSSTYVHNFNWDGGCAGIVNSPPLDLGPYLAAGDNRLEIMLSDTCGVAEGNSDLYLVGTGTLSQ
jgi:secreted trypsin-like serine protease